MHGPRPSDIGRHPLTVSPQLTRADPTHVCTNKHTCLALARASVRATQHADVPLEIRRAADARRGAPFLLVGVSKAVAVDADLLRLDGLEMAWKSQNVSRTLQRAC
jgi:hypothetical protein